MTAYMGDWVSAIRYYAYSAVARSYSTWTWTRQSKEVCFKEQITQYANTAGSLYVLIVENKILKVIYYISFIVTNIKYV